MVTELVKGEITKQTPEALLPPAPSTSVVESLNFTLSGPQNTIPFHEYNAKTHQYIQLYLSQLEEIALLGFTNNDNSYPHFNCQFHHYSFLPISL